MTIREFSRLLGLHPNTVKGLERKGIIKPLRDRNGWRRYTEIDLERARQYFFGEQAEREAEE